MKSISGSINALLDSKDEHERREKEKPKTYNQNVLAERAGDSGEEDDLSTIADQVIQEQNHIRQLENLKREINYKWPTPKGQPSTWELILKAREKAIERKKIRIEKQKQQAIKNKKKWEQIRLEAGKGVIILAVICGLYFYISFACKGCI